MHKSITSSLTGLLFSVSAWAAVDLNRATQSELEAVKGIGPVKAKAILEYRQRHGPFRNVESLAAVRGFGKASVAKLQGELSVDAARAERRRKP